jgi:hypothetical protein
MSTFDININSIPTLTLNPVPIDPLTIANVQKVAPLGVHIKELNQIAPIQVESLRVDHVRHVDPLRIEQLDITRLPTVNLTLSQLPGVDLTVRRVPPVAISLQQEFDLSSHYTLRASLLGLEFMQLQLQGKTKIVPRDCAPRTHSRVQERSFPDVVVYPGIPGRLVETGVRTVTRVTRPRTHKAAIAPLEVGIPRFDYSLEQTPGVRGG